MRQRARRTLALLAAVFGLGAVVSTVLLVTSSEGTAVGANVFVNPPGPIDANNSPSVARNPTLPENLVVVHRVDRPRFSAQLLWSVNNGATWLPTALPLPPDKDRPFAPDAAFGPDGRLWVVYSNLEGNGNVPTNLWLASSGDSGRTLSEPAHVAGRLTFQPRIAVDPRGTVHITWLQGAEVGPLRFPTFPNPVVAVSSTDGRTFTQPVQVNDQSRQRVGAASPVIDSRGDLVVLYQDFRDDRRDYENLEGPPWEEPFTLVVTRSGDGGRTFSPGVEVDAGVLPTRRFLIFLPEFPSIAAGPAGSLYVAWADGRNGDDDVFLRRSTDGGRTWSAPTRVNDNPVGDRTSQYLPRLSVASDGRVDVLFLDRRRDTRNVMTDAFLATSRDGGGSFTNARVSSRSFDSRVGSSADPKLEIDFGSRLGVVSDGDEAFGVWTDTRLGTEDTGRQDIAGARVRPASPPSPSPGVVAVLLAAGLACLAGWWLAGRGGTRLPDTGAGDRGARGQVGDSPPAAVGSTPAGPSSTMDTMEPSEPDRA